MLNIFTGAERGYLGRELKQYVDGVNVDYGDVLNVYETGLFDNMFHFAGPSDVYDFENTDAVVDVIVNGSINMLKLTKNYGQKFIFASTQGVMDPDNIYCYSKLLVEKYIKSVYNNYVILRIPRVYSKCRKKGLMRQIRENKIPPQDMNNVVEFITLQDFIDQTIPALNKIGTTHEYNITNRRTIEDIKQWIEE